VEVNPQNDIQLPNFILSSLYKPKYLTKTYTLKHWLLICQCLLERCLVYVGGQMHIEIQIIFYHRKKLERGIIFEISPFNYTLI